MSLLEDARSKVRRRGPVCSVASYVDRNPEIEEELLDMLRGWPDITFTAMAEALQDRNIDLNDDQLARHYRSVVARKPGGCRCEI